MTPFPRRHRVTRPAVALLLLSCAGCASDERRAARLHDEARRLVAEERLDDAVERFEQVLSEYPRTEVAAAVREEIRIYRSLVDAVRVYPSRSARDVMVRVARAVEAHRHRRRSYPRRLEALVPDFLDAVPSDPWGHPLVYRRVGRRGYRLECLGSDGDGGGVGDAADLVVENGRFVRDAGR